MLSLEGRDLAGDRAAIRRVLGHLVRASITSTGQALDTATGSQALEGETRTSGSQVSVQRGGPRLVL